MTDINKINNLLKELKEYSELQNQLKAQIEDLQNQAKAIMKENGTDELISATGTKVTYREVISKRFDSTAFKKDFADIYEEYQKPSRSMRFTLH